MKAIESYPRVKDRPRIYSPAKNWLGVNSIALFLTIGVIYLVYRSRLPASFLFFPPATPFYPIVGLFTHTFQLLCCVPPIVCLFTLYLSFRLKKRIKNEGFLIASAIVTGIFAINELYRGHIILLSLGIPKTTSIGFFAIVPIVYGICFWPRIRRTSYPILLLAIALLVVAIAVDSARLGNGEIASLSEGIPKLMSGLNFALYFSEICSAEIARAIGRAGIQEPVFRSQKP